jgi:hypothetical protein
MRAALSHLDDILAKQCEVIVTRRGRQLARILPAHAQQPIPSRAALRASMPKPKVPSEKLIRKDRE